MSEESIIRAAVNVLLSTAIDLIQNDPHMWSTRPCPTCRAVTSILGRDFGCCRFKADRIASQALKANESKGGVQS